MLFEVLIIFQATLLDDHMRDLRRVIRPGSKRLNWNSLGIGDFIIKCENVCMRIQKKISYFYHIVFICHQISFQNVKMSESFMVL